jgi:DNA-directed RNA polymerase subunit RPC12/RpoP
VSDKAKITTAGGVLLLAGLIYYVRSGNANTLTSRTDFNTQLKCLSCSEQFKVNLNVEARPPFACEKCGKPAAWFLWECEKCHTLFAPAPEGEPPRQPMMPKCPKCGSGSTGRASLEG